MDMDVYKVVTASGQCYTALYVFFATPFSAGMVLLFSTNSHVRDLTWKPWGPAFTSLTQNIFSKLNKKVQFTGHGSVFS